MFKIISAAKAAGKLSSVAAAAAALLAAGWAGTVQAETLASWDLSGKVNTNETISANADSLSEGIAMESAILSRNAQGGGKTDNGFGSKGISTGTTGTFFTISFSIATNHTVTPESLSFSIKRGGSSGPTNYMWRCFKNGEEVELGNNITPIDDIDIHSDSLSLASIGVLPPSTTIELKLDAASKGASGVLFLNEALTLTGLAEPVSPGGGDEPSPTQPTIGAIGDFSILAGETTNVAVNISGNVGTTISTNLYVIVNGMEESPGLFATLENGAISISATKADAGTKTLRVRLIVDEGLETEEIVQEDFDVKVLLPLKTLAEWTISGKSSDNQRPEADKPFHEAISKANLSLGNCNTGGGNGTFGASGFKGIDSFEEAVESNKYLQVAFTSRENYRIEPTSMEYNIIRTGTGPTNFQWVGIVDGEKTTLLGNGVSLDKAVDKDKSMSFTLDLSALGELDLGASVELRVYAWGVEATQNTGTFSFNNPKLTVKGLAEREASVVVLPSIGAIADQTIFAGETNAIEVAFSGDMEYATETNHVALSGNVGGVCWITDGMAYYAPVEGDADLAQPLEFKVELIVEQGGNVQYTNFTYLTTVLRKPTLALANGETIQESFNSMGTNAVAALPLAWAFAGTGDLFSNKYDKVAGTITLAYDVRSTNTNFRGGTDANFTSAGYYNFGAGKASEADERAPGFLSTSNTSTGLRTAALMVPIKNTGTSEIRSLRVSYSVEKYKTGRGKTVELRVSRDGQTWISAGWNFMTTTEDDDTNNDGKIDSNDCHVYSGEDGDELPLPELKRGNLILDGPLAVGEVLYLGWFCYATSGSTTANVQALAVDDVRISAGNPDMTVIMMK